MRKRTETMRRVNTMLQVLHSQWLPTWSLHKVQAVRVKWESRCTAVHPANHTKAQGHDRHTLKSTYFWPLQIIKLSSFLDILSRINSKQEVKSKTVGGLHLSHGSPNSQQRALKNGILSLPAE